MCQKRYHFIIRAESVSSHEDDEEEDVDLEDEDEDEEKSYFNSCSSCSSSLLHFSDSRFTFL